ncbi:MAG TPA: Gfo/Idh/MocA family oxidoreductase [Pyrinomonadaceae bacterium]|nr:Gfo/Idh/MocA family oxidoreductase [Pyrinomonadaceae bacterium]
MIRIALAGCGEHSRTSHAAPLSRYAATHPGEIELAAACDLNVERANEFCRSFDFLRPYTDLDQMLQVEKPDACVCVMPMAKIVEVGIKLLQRQIPCVIEKPLGTSLAEIEQMAEVARETQTPHMVSVNRRFMPYLNQARTWMQERGPVRYVRASQIRHQRSEADFIWSTGIHVLDALRHLAGEVESFAVTIPDEKWYLISLTFRSGATGYVEILPTAGMVEESYEMFAEGCRARVTAGSGTQRSLECWQDGKLVIESRASEEEPEDLRNGSYQEVEEFILSLRTGKRPQPSIEDILPSARIGFAISK